MTIEEVHDEVAEAMLGLERCFKPGVKLTFLMRNPSEPDGSLIFTSDDFGEIHKALTRLEEKGKIEYDLRVTTLSLE